MSNPSTRVLAVVFPKPNSAPDGATVGLDAAAGIADLVAGPSAQGVEFKVLSEPTFTEFQQTIESYKPTLVYLGASYNFAQNQQTGVVEDIAFKDGPPSTPLVDAFSGNDIQSVYLDGAIDPEIGTKLQEKGISNVVTWGPLLAGTPPKQIPAIVAAHFSHIFLTAVVQLAAVAHEAFALASHVVQAHFTTQADGNYQAPELPQLLSSNKAVLPDNSSIPVPEIPGIDVSQPMATSVPGWVDIRLLAPRAELRLLLVGGSSLIDGHKLSFLGEALRALLVLETRSLTLVNTTPCAKVPANLPAGCTALRCEVRTTSGQTTSVILGGQPDVLQEPKLVEHALRMTLVADSLSLQFRLPPPGVAVPVPRTSAAIAAGAPVVDTLVLTSVWAVQILRSLSQEQQHKGLVSMGVAAVGGTATAAVSSADAQRLKMMVAGITGVPVTSPTSPNAAVGAGGASEGVGNGVGGDPSLASPGADGGGEGGDGGVGNHSFRTQDQTMDDAAPSFSGHLPGYDPSKRPPLAQCTEEEFITDLVEFLTILRGKPIDRSKFPDAVLNGLPLDLWGLYREVVTRGGFHAGNQINWKGQVFGNMKNWTETNRQTGVGNALKRHYQNFLMEYEMAHPRDVIKDRCALCSSGDAGGSDWLCCNTCENWVHFSCDKRDLGVYKDYAAGSGKTYQCPTCDGAKRQKTG